MRIPFVIFLLSHFISPLLCCLIFVLVCSFPYQVFISCVSEPDIQCNCSSVVHFLCHRTQHRHYTHRRRLYNRKQGQDHKIVGVGDGAENEGRKGRTCEKEDIKYKTRGNTTAHIQAHVITTPNGWSERRVGQSHRHTNVCRISALLSGVFYRAHPAHDAASEAAFPACAHLEPPHRRYVPRRDLRNIS